MNVMGGSGTPAVLAQGKRNRRTDRSTLPGKRCRAVGGVWPPDSSNRISAILSTGKTVPPGSGETAGERSTNCGYDLFAQCVRLRSEINYHAPHDASPTWCPVLAVPL